MAGNFTFQIKGIKELQKRFDTLPQDLQDEIVGEIQAWGDDINREQQALISSQKIVDRGALRQGTKSVPLPDGVRLISNVKYSPFIEFGTGATVKVPSELIDYAQQFRGKGIRQVNIKPRPYFFPPYFRNRPLLLPRLKEVIKNRR